MGTEWGGAMKEGLLAPRLSRDFYVSFCVKGDVEAMYNTVPFPRDLQSLGE